jgi:E3 ubiquitin-protein ligase RBBP6
MESSCCPQPKIPSPTSSATSKGEPKVSLVNEGMTNIQEIVDGEKVVSATKQVS